MLRRLFSIVVLSLCAAVTVNAQVGAGSLKGTVKDKKSSEPLPFVSVVIERGGTQVTGGSTDFDGNYFIKPIDPGTYDVVIAYTGYQPSRQTGVVINSNQITFLDITLNSGIELVEFEVVEYNVPLIQRDGGASGGTVTREDIAKMPGRSAASIATTVAGASTAGTEDNEISIRGSRGENTYYYIDGVKVPAGAGTGLPKSAIEEVQVITGGVPANYGDVTGGLINITTRGPSRNFSGGFEYLTSGYKVGNDITDIVGLDKFAFNQVEGSLFGPILFKKDSLGNKEKPLIGFFLSGQYSNIVDPSPSYLGDVRVDPALRASILENPARLVSTGGDDFTLTYASDYLRTGDIESIKTRQNAGEKRYLASGKIDITTSPTITLTMGGSMDFADVQDYNRKNALLNADNNYRKKDNTFRGFIKFTQRFLNRTEEEEKKATIQNAYYSLQLDYSRYQSNIQDFEHGEKFFDYGYVGRFDIYSAPQYELDFINARWNNVGLRDTLVTFTPGTQNPDLASINNFYFNALPNETFPIGDLFSAPGAPEDPNYIGYYNNFAETQARGVIWNGLRPRDLYGLWNNIGFLDDPDGAEYRKRQNDQIRFTALGSADIGDHAVSVGVEYEQLTQRRYDLAPIGLWTRARALANFHTSEYETETPTAIFQIPFSPLPFYVFSPLVGSDQQNFDRNLRTSLGLDPNGSDFINVDALDPSAFSLDMFSADELINDGNNLVNFAGYDHVGNRLTSKPSFDSFFTAKDEKGNFTRLQAPFQPIYIAGYVMDKFAFDDIIFNVGVRVDRYDANQNVLTDPYLMQEAYTAGSTVPDQDIANQLANRPSNIGDDFVVYVNDEANAITIKGYRDGDTWYSATGVELNDGGSSVQEAGEIHPYLIEKGLASDVEGSRLSKKAFSDYTPAVNVMPRIAFSFPISDEAVFFAHYDVLVQRPNAIYSRGDLAEYAFYEVSLNELNNPNLKPTKTIDYELGFQQVLSKSSSLKLSAFYRELRDQIQIVNRNNAWPRSYRSYDNIDFGTVKGFSAAFDLRRTGNIWMRATYTLQFADSTGSGPRSGLAVINSGQANLRTISPLDFDQRHRFTGTIDYRYGSGKDYNGPMLFGKPILSRTGLNTVVILGSGTPYSASSQVVNEGADNTNYRLDGKLNGSRLPWQFSTDMQLDRDFPLHFGGKDGDKAKTSNLNLYLLVTNVFNTQNITDVFRYTGSPNNDGYIEQLTDRSQIDPDAFRDLYAIKVNDPGNYGAPRTIRLGVRFDF
ncbi:MAG: carboxypeptidase regulatory-like domain-containing protein [Flavobacteriales bacterium]|nr:carboxypeptidase regulatory-like domain-containing protein [Flavobacteriales bacterium]